jgi:rhodanese-related sulfurtransferase
MEIVHISMNHVVEDTYRLNGVLIDVRDREDYAKGHIPGAINIPMDYIDGDQVFMKRERPLVFYCDRGSQSILAARKYMQAGYEVVNVVGGFAYYKGYVEKKETVIPGYGYKAVIS